MSSRFPFISSSSRPLVRKVARVGIYVSCIFIAAMWLYAFVFASRESINKIKDEEWAARSQLRCEQAFNERITLTDMSEMDPKDPASLAIKATIVDKATDTIVAMINDLEKDQPSDDKGQALVPQWIADYRVYIQDRRDYTAELRLGRLPTFSETAVEGVPISERLGKFARENRMRACQPPIDLVI